MTRWCRSCGQDNLNSILSLGNQYLSDFCDSDEKPSCFPLDLMLCPQCCLLQLANTVPAELLYTDRYGYRSGMNQTMRSHLQGIADRAGQLAMVEKSDIIVDIGSNDGTLLKSYRGTVGRRVGFDAIAKFAADYSGTGIDFVNDYFNKKSYLAAASGKAKIITAISMFYDLEEPDCFVQDMADILDEEGIIIVQQNYLLTMLLNNAFDNIVHEHLEYFSLLSMENIINRHGLEIFDVELNDLNGGSFRTYICHKGRRKVLDSVDRLRKYEEEHGVRDSRIYTEFAERIAGIRDRLHDFIQHEVKSGKTVYAYGASTRGNTLLQYCGLDNTLISKAVEKNAEKWGKKIASVGIPIISEEQGRREKPDYMLVLPWHFKEEFISREGHYLKQGGKFIFPLPDIEIISDRSK